jgi:hypothetical protein|tara:strand:- start:1372 stop:1557 length:186 start_codon:yes stop_codon:yes gene_type:complete
LTPRSRRKFVASYVVNRSSRLLLTCARDSTFRVDAFQSFARTSRALANAPTNRAVARRGDS